MHKTSKIKVHINFELLSTVPSGSPQQLVIVSVTSTSIVLEWNPPRFEEQNGNITGYSISICSEVSGHCHSEISEDNSHTVTGLHPFYTYSLNVAAITTDAGPPSNSKQATCLEDGKIVSSTIVCAQNNIASVSYFAPYGGAVLPINF